MAYQYAKFLLNVAQLLAMIWYAHLEQMGVPRLLDEHFPTHGNWQGLSLAQPGTGPGTTTRPRREWPLRAHGRRTTDYDRTPVSSSPATFPAELLVLIAPNTKPPTNEAMKPLPPETLGQGKICQCLGIGIVYCAKISPYESLAKFATR